MVESPLLPRWVQFNMLSSHISNLLYLCCCTEWEKKVEHYICMQIRAPALARTPTFKTFKAQVQIVLTRAEASWFHSWMCRFKLLLQPFIYSPTYNIHKPLRPRFSFKSTLEHHWMTSGFVLGLRTSYRKSCGAHQFCSVLYVNHFWDQTWIIRKLNIHL